MPTDDQRRYPRSQARLTGTQIIGSRRLPREVTNISGGGFFIAAVWEAARTGELVVVEFADTAGPFLVTGEVAYITETGFGVRATRADWRRLNELIAATERGP